MPGIAGFIGRSGSIPEPELVPRMIATMRHEKFYKSGTSRHATLGVEVGWMAHPNSYADGMPVWNANRDIALIVSGEHYGSADVPAGDGNTPAQLVHAYERLGPRFLEQLNGLFCGVLVDLRASRVVLFNDRYGLSRIYYHERPEGLYFASEAKALLRVRPELRRFDPRGLGEWFACGAPLQNRTLFPGVSLLPGGSAWTQEPGMALRKECYFTPESWERQTALAPAAYAEELKATFARILPRYFEGPERVGLSLTGGLDSRLIAAWAPCQPFKLHTFTFGGVRRECADVTIARRVAQQWQQYHEVIKVNRRLFEEFPVLAQRSVTITDGAQDVTGAPGLFVNRAFRALAPVRLTGNYGDEILRGNIPFRANGAHDGFLTGELAPAIAEAGSTFAAERAGVALSFALFKQVPWYHYARWALEQSQLTNRSPFLDNELVALAYRAPTTGPTPTAVTAQLIAEGNPLLAAIPSDRGLLGGPSRLLRGARALRQGLAIRAEYAFDYGMPQALVTVDRALARLHLEQWFLGRHKFYHFRSWYRGPLAGYVREILLDPLTRSRSYLDPARVEAIVNNHLSGRRNHTLAIHKLLTAELMERHVLAETP